MVDATSFGHTIFCDDIRQEVGGKLSYMGVYDAAIIVPEFPITIRQLCARVRYYESAEIEDMPVTIKVLGPSEDGVLLEQELDMSVLRRHAHLDEIGRTFIRDMPDVSSTYIWDDTITVWSPLVVEETGLLRVRAYRGDETIKLGALRIMSVAQRELEVQAVEEKLARGQKPT